MALCDHLQIPLMDMDAKYLGFPFFWGRSKTEAYSYLNERALSKMQGWKSKRLNSAGREVMLKHVVQAVPCYAMFCFLLSKKFCKKMNRNIRKFFWSGSPEDMKIHWVGGDDFCKAKSQGGLGFRDLHCFNLALLAKQGWRLIQNPNAFWARMLKAIYFPRSDFMNARKGNRPSWAWSSIIRGRDVLEKGLRWQIHGGRSVNFWNPHSPNFRIQSPKPPWADNLKVADFINTTSGEWSIPKLKQVLSEEEALSISSIPISKTGTKDSTLWDFTTNGNYSVKSGYHKIWNDLILSKPDKPSSSINPPPAFWKFLWNLSIPPKLKHFWWKVCQNRLATKENLMRRNCANTPLCPRCGNYSESIEHLFFHCKWAKKVWFKSPISGGFFPNNINSALSWSIAAKEEMEKGSWSSDFLAKAIFIAWYIWIARNEMIFQGKTVSPQGVMARALGAWGEFTTAKEAVQIHVPPSDRPPPAPKLWAAPPSGKLKINCDASWTDSAQKGWGGIILRNSKGYLLDGRRSCISANSAFLAEASILREACLFAKALNLRNVSIESDCTSLISLSVSELVPPWEVSALITDIRKIGADLELSFCWTPREGNAAAHWIASSRASFLGCNWVSIPPAPLLTILCNDAVVYQ